MGAEEERLRPPSIWIRDGIAENRQDRQGERTGMRIKDK